MPKRKKRSYRSNFTMTDSIGQRFDYKSGDNLKMHLDFKASGVVNLVDEYPLENLSYGPGGYKQLTREYPHRSWRWYGSLNKTGLGHPSGLSSKKAYLDNVSWLEMHNNNTSVTWHYTADLQIDSIEGNSGTSIPDAVRERLPIDPRKLTRPAQGDPHQLNVAFLDNNQTSGVPDSSNSSIMFSQSKALVPWKDNAWNAWTVSFFLRIEEDTSQPKIPILLLRPGSNAPAAAPEGEHFNDREFRGIYINMSRPTGGSDLVFNVTFNDGTGAAQSANGGRRYFQSTLGTPQNLYDSASYYERYPYNGSGDKATGALASDANFIHVTIRFDPNNPIIFNEDVNYPQGTAETGYDANKTVEDQAPVMIFLNGMHQGGPPTPLNRGKWIASGNNGSGAHTDYNTGTETTGKGHKHLSSTRAYVPSKFGGKEDWSEGAPNADAYMSIGSRYGEQHQNIELEDDFSISNLMWWDKPLGQEEIRALFLSWFQEPSGVQSGFTTLSPRVLLSDLENQKDPSYISRRGTNSAFGSGAKVTYDPTFKDHIAEAEDIRLQKEQINLRPSVIDDLVGNLVFTIVGNDGVKSSTFSLVDGENVQIPAGNVRIDATQFLSPRARSSSRVRTLDVARAIAVAIEKESKESGLGISVKLKANRIELTDKYKASINYKHSSTHRYVYEPPRSRIPANKIQPNRKYKITFNGGTTNFATTFGASNSNFGTEFVAGNNVTLATIASLDPTDNVQEIGIKPKVSRIVTNITGVDPRRFRPRVISTYSNVPRIYHGLNVSADKSDVVIEDLVVHDMPTLISRAPVRKSSAYATNILESDEPTRPFVEDNRFVGFGIIDSPDLVANKEGALISQSTIGIPASEFGRQYTARIRDRDCVTLNLRNNFPMVLRSIGENANRVTSWLTFHPEKIP